MEMTKKKISNWLYYNGWILALAAVLLVIFGSMIRTKIEAARLRCDYTVAYVGTEVLASDAVDALKAQFCALGTDVDGDGEVTVRLKQFIVSEESALEEDVAYGRAAEIALLSDISEGESYFFLVEHPEAFQQDFQLMANPDGSPSAQDDFGVWDKVYRWGDCPALDVPELDGLYLGRRCFVDPRMKSNSPENQALWSRLTEDATPPQN